MIEHLFDNAAALLDLFKYKILLFLSITIDNLRIKVTNCNSSINKLCVVLTIIILLKNNIDISFMLTVFPDGSNFWRVLSSIISECSILIKLYIH